MQSSGEQALVTKDDDTFEEEDESARAAAVLDSNEALIWHAIATNEV